MSGHVQPLQSCDHVDSGDCTRKPLDLGVGRRRRSCRRKLGAGMSGRFRLT